MSDPPGIPFGFGDLDPEALRDAPLFRELQRVMSGSVGPVNWELARQVAVAIAAEAGEDPEPDVGSTARWEEVVRVAELHVARLTGLPPEVTPVRPVRRTTWVAAMIGGLRGVVEPAAARISQALERATRDQLPPEAAGASAVFSHLGPLLQGTQVGQVFGGLARRAAGRFDVAIPAPGTAELLIVEANVAAFERDWSLDPTELRTFVALHEIAHRSAFARPWVAHRFAQIVDDYLAGYQIDVEGIQRAFESFDPSDPEGLQALLGVEDGAVFGPVLDAEQRLKLARIQAFAAAAEGYADHVTHLVAARLLPGHDRIHEATRRRGEERAAEAVFERLLGVEIPDDLWTRGAAFCDAVAEATDEAALATMWDSPDAMPSLPEIDEPRLWLARSV
jgi:putative hydrolase